MLAKNTQRFILYTAFAQSLLLLAIHELMERDIWPGTSIPARTLWYTLTLALPTAVCLLLRDVRDRRFWGMLAIYGAVLVPLALHTGAQYVPVHHTEPSSVFFPYVLCQLGLWFLATFFLEAAQEGRRIWHTPGDVCAYAWRNFLTLGLLGLFFGVLTLVLLMWALLFKLLNIEFFWFLFFDSHRFIYPFFGVAGGIGVLILRNQANVVTLMEKIAGALLRILLPLVAFIAALFLATLPFTGVQLLWKTGEGTFLMMWLVCLMLLLVNVTRQHEQDTYQHLLQVVVKVSFLLLPVYLGLSAWGISLRVGQYGWTYERLWTVVILLLQSSFVIAYALAMYLPGRHWVERMPALNKNLGALVAAVLVLINTSALDLRRLSVADQMRRLDEGKVTQEQFDYAYLRFSLGEYGYQAALDLSASPTISGDPLRSAYLKKVIAAENRWSVMHPRSKADIKILPVGASVPAEVMALTEQSDNRPTFCGPVNAEQCVIIKTNITGDGQPEYLLVQDYGYSIQVIQQVSGKWKSIAYLESNSPDSKRLTQALASGDFKLVKPLYQDVVVDGIRYQVKPSSSP